MKLIDRILGPVGTKSDEEWDWYSEPTGTVEKENPIQTEIAHEYGSAIYTTKLDNLYNVAYSNIEVAGRGVDLVVDSSSQIYFDVKESLGFSAAHNFPFKGKTLNTLLNKRPNPYEDRSSFWRNVFMDLVIEGNAFLYFDGAGIYVLPSSQVEILTDKVTFVKGYKYSGSTATFKPHEIIHIKENASNSIYRGDSRLASARKSINTMLAMLDYQNNFFKNGAVPGLALETPDTLSPRIKERMVNQWMQKYNPRTGGRRPVVLDGGLKIRPINDKSFQELDFSKSVEDHEARILKAIGVPPIILNSGNNANITPNLKLFHLMTVVPLVEKVLSSLERYFAFDLELDTSKVRALRPELKDEAEYYSSLVNNGLITGDEARVELRREKIGTPVMTEIRIPQNIAGSGTGVTGQEGGRPSEGDSNE